MADISYRIDYPTFDNRDMGGGGTGSSNRKPTYYAILKITFKKNGQLITGVTYNGWYSSYNSDGSSSTNTIYNGRSLNSSIIGISPYSYFPGKYGSITLNTKSPDGTTYSTATKQFQYSSTAGLSNGRITELVFDVYDSNVILPSIYKPFYFNAVLKMAKNEQYMDFYCSIANAIPYRLNDGSYVIGTPTLTIDSTTWYFYNKAQYYQTPQKINDSCIYETCELSYVDMYTKEVEGRYFYVPSAASSLTKNYEIKFNAKFKLEGMDPTMPHNYAFSVKEGAPIQYNGDLDVMTAEDSLYGVKFFDVKKDDDKGSNDDPYIYSDDISYGGIRHFFAESNDLNGESGQRPGLLKSMEDISALNGYQTDPQIWKSIHTFVWRGSGNVDFNLYDLEFDTEYDNDNNVNTHFITTNQAGTKLKNKIYYIGIADKYTMLSGTEIHNTSSDYGIETTENKYSLYTKVPRHTNVLSILYIQKFA